MCEGDGRPSCRWAQVRDGALEAEFLRFKTERQSVSIVLAQKRCSAVAIVRLVVGEDTKGVNQLREVWRRNAEWQGVVGRTKNLDKMNCAAYIKCVLEQVQSSDMY